MPRRLAYRAGRAIGRGSAMRDVWQRDSNVAVRLGMEDLRHKNDLERLSQSFQAKQEDADRTRGILQEAAQAERARQETNMHSENLGALMAIAGQTPSEGELDSPYTMRGYVEGRKQMGDVEGLDSLAGFLSEKTGIPKAAAKFVAKRSPSSALATVSKGTGDHTKGMGTEFRTFLASKNVDRADRSAVAASAKEWLDIQWSKGKAKTTIAAKKEVQKQFNVLSKLSGGGMFDDEVVPILLADPEMRDAVDEFSDEIDWNKVHELLQVKWGVAEKKVETERAEEGGKKVRQSDFGVKEFGMLVRDVMGPRGK